MTVAYLMDHAPKERTMIPKDKLRSMSLDTLMELNRALVEVIKEKRHDVGQQVRWSLHPGQAVFFDSKTRGRVTGTLRQINRTKAIVSVPDPSPGRGPIQWTVPLSMLHAAPSHNKPTAIPPGMPTF